MTIEWKVEIRQIKDLKSHPKNPRKLSKHDAKHLKESLEKFGLIDKPIVNLDNIVIGGHQRISVLKSQKVSSVECWIPSRLLTEKEVEELNIRLNRNTGEWDFDILSEKWDEQDLLNWGFKDGEIPGFDLNGELENDSEVLEPGKDEDAITKLGDLIELDGHRLVCGDSTLPEIVEKCIGKEIPILMITDPPYGVEYDASWRKDIKGKHGVAARAMGKVQNDDKINWALAWHLFPGFVVYVWHAAWFSSEVHKSLLDSGFKIINQIVWVKQHFAMSRGDYHWQHEPCWYAVKEGSKHNWQGARDQSTIWEVSNLNAFGASKDEENERTAHSTQKPLECMARPIRNNTTKGEGVYDPFLGSGTTLLAAEQLCRVCYGIELSPAYCDIIVKRWIKNRNKRGLSDNVKLNGKETKDYQAI